MSVDENAPMGSIVSDSSRPVDAIVVVEDDLVLQVLIADIVTESGTHCHAFTTCDEALQYLLDGNPCQAVITDHGVPGKLQGLDLLVEVQERWPAVHGVLTSGYDLADLTLPPNCVYLPKPWTLIALLAALGNCPP